MIYFYFFIWAVEAIQTSGKINIPGMHTLSCICMDIQVSPAGEPSTTPRFPRRFMGEFQGIIPAEISSWLPCGNSGEMKGNFLCGYFCLLSQWNPWGYFPRASLKNFKMQFNDIGRVPVMWKYPSDDLMPFIGELKCLQVWRNFPLISSPIQKFSLNFHGDSRFTYNPNIHVDSLHQQPQSLGIPHGIREILPAGIPYWFNIA